MSKKIDLHGQRFGKLTVVKEAGRNRCGQVLWECTCDCGGIAISSSANLTRGQSKSCGCISHQARDLSGQRFGSLTAIQRVENDGSIRNPNRSALWLCRCDCGREKVMPSNSLITGNTESCGDCSFGRYEFVDDYVVGHFEKGACFTISACDYEEVSKHRWWKEKSSGYFISSINGSQVYLHRFLLPDKVGYVCDHRNRQKTDNRRTNLRYATAAQNSRNRSIASNNTTGYIGVCWHIHNKKFVAGIKVNGRTINLGAFDTAEAAARARDQAAVFYFGEFANLNFGEYSA